MTPTQRAGNASGLGLEPGIRLAIHQCAVCPVVRPVWPTAGALGVCFLNATNTCAHRMSVDNTLSAEKQSMVRASEEHTARAGSCLATLGHGDAGSPRWGMPVAPHGTHTTHTEGTRIDSTASQKRDNTRHHCLQHFILPAPFRVYHLDYQPCARCRFTILLAASPPPPTPACAVRRYLSIVGCRLGFEERVQASEGVLLIRRPHVFAAWFRHRV